jgi:di/tricarboxylate transporter
LVLSNSLSNFLGEKKRRGSKSVLNSTIIDWLRSRANLLLDIFLAGNYKIAYIMRVISRSENGKIGNTLVAQIPLSICCILLVTLLNN